MLKHPRTGSSPVGGACVRVKDIPGPPPAPSSFHISNYLPIENRSITAKVSYATPTTLPATLPTTPLQHGSEEDDRSMMDMMPEIGATVIIDAG